MITVRKLQSLPPKTRLRKIVTLMEEWEHGFTRRKNVDRDYQRRVMRLLLDQPELLQSAHILGITRYLELIETPIEDEDRELFLRVLHNIRYGIMDTLGLAPADWDFYDETSCSLVRNAADTLPMGLYLDDIRSPYNVGSIFRTAEAFGVERIVLSEYTAAPTHPRSLRTSMGCTEILPWEISSLEKIADRNLVFALELGGVPLDHFTFPRKGVVILGSEELGIGPEAREIARKSAGIVSIPLRGAKASLNVAVATGILLHAWVSALTGTP